ncbi:hypothetical protein B0H19DRAFT_1217942 [Mycena capillaripes]|nr:hypothetical protein B0H19DRAFT_1217942 [Mycena capillaripes]
MTSIQEGHTSANEMDEPHALLKMYREMEQPVPKPSWTFPSPFIPYANLPKHSMARDLMSWGPQPRTLAELRMYGLSWAIRSKPEWQRKISDPLTENMITYVFAELEGYARLTDASSGIECGPFDAIWFSDRLVSREVADRLRSNVLELEDVPNDLKDWHPGSNEQVFDLVHPSLYCIVYGRTLEGSHLNVLPPPLTSTSNQFCWLPSDFSVDAADGTVKLVSPYINTCTRTSTKRCIISSNPCYPRITDPCIWDEGEVDYPDGATGEEYQKLKEEAEKTLPESSGEYTGKLEKTLMPYSLHGKTIQCIIKLANIQLTVEYPEYMGGSWHVKGMLNEHIMASGIYYYEEENISESRLAFRVTTGAPVYHQQDDDMCMDILYGLQRNSHCCQDLGSIATTAGRALAWPNIYQHRVSPFCLLDPTKPGHRKILAIFLVDPSIAPIPSATTVPPQQADWAFEALEEALPPELCNIIREHVPDTLVSREEAEMARLLLMRERTQFVKVHDRELKHNFNMCEH